MAVEVVGQRHASTHGVVALVGHLQVGVGGMCIAVAQVEVPVARQPEAEEDVGADVAHQLGAYHVVILVDLRLVGYPSDGEAQVQLVVERGVAREVDDGCSLYDVCQHGCAQLVVGEEDARADAGIGPHLVGVAGPLQGILQPQGGRAGDVDALGVGAPEVSVVLHDAAGHGVGLKAVHVGGVGPKV